MADMSWNLSHNAPSPLKNGFPEQQKWSDQNNDVMKMTHELDS